jgi:hypothetical protein
MTNPCSRSTRAAKAASARQSLAKMRSLPAEPGQIGPDPTFVSPAVTCDRVILSAEHVGSLASS